MPEPGSHPDRRAEPREDPQERRHHDAVFTLARAAERHDPETGRHLLRIKDRVSAIARELGLDDPEGLGIDAMLHDVGKLHVDPAILRKPGPLDDEERRAVEAHTVLGEALLSDRPSLARAARIARSHHERWDGEGYPDGLAGADIPLAARITAAADLLDALLAERAYKPGWSRDEALARVREESGRHLDPDVARALLRAEGAD